MDVRVIEEEGRRSVEVRVYCAPGDPRAGRIVERLRVAEGRLVGYAPDGSVAKRVIPLDDVLLVETTDRRALIRTLSGETLESPMRLFELEGALDGTEFVRVSRQALVNFDHVRSIRPELYGRLVLELTGGGSVLVSRSYTGDIKEKIGAVR